MTDVVQALQAVALVVLGVSLLTVRRRVTRLQRRLDVVVEETRQRFAAWAKLERARQNREWN